VVNLTSQTCVTCGRVDGIRHVVYTMLLCCRYVSIAAVSTDSVTVIRVSANTCCGHVAVRAIVEFNVSAQIRVGINCGMVFS